MTAMSVLRDRIKRSLARSEPDPVVLTGLFETLGWPSARMVSRATRLVPHSVTQLVLAGLPRVAITVGDDGESAVRSVAAAYSSEARYVVEWGSRAVRLLETSRWRSSPGDTELASSSTDDPTSVHALMLLLSPGEVAAATPSRLLESAPSPRAALADKLGQALADLRLEIADSRAIVSGPVDETDVLLLRLFHQLLFARFFEDRHGPHRLGRVEALVGEADPRPGLEALLRAYGERHDSELFDAPAFRVDDLPLTSLRGVLQALTEPWQEMEVDFGLTQADIAGRLYQSYLRRRPEIVTSEAALFPRAQAVDLQAKLAAYYTPPVLAQRVVREALGRWLTGARPTEPSEVRVLDPACGSGAFLVAAFRELVEYFAGQRGRPLDDAERREILVSSIFGVDIDRAAVLLARSHLVEEADLKGRLPQLSENVRVGDALLAPPSYAGTTESSAVPWSTLGAFNAVITNPPFGSQLVHSQAGTKEYRAVLGERYPRSSSWGVDLAYRFVELGLQLLSPGGVAGFVLPRTILSGPSAKGVRALLAERGVAQFTDYRGLQVFPGISTYVTTMTVWNDPDRGAEAPALVSEYVPDSRVPRELVLDPEVKTGLRPPISARWPQSVLRGDDWTPFALQWAHNLSEEIGVPSERFGDGNGHRRVVHGTQTGNDESFLLDDERVAPGDDDDSVRLDGSVIPSWAVPHYAGGPTILPFRLRQGRRLLSPYSHAAKLEIPDPSLAALVKRLGGIPKHAQPGALLTLRGPKVLLRAFGQELAAAADPDGAWITKKGTGGGLAISVEPMSPWMLEGVATLLNSALYQWLLRGFGKPRADESVEILRGHVEALPWPSLPESGWRRLAAAADEVRGALDLEEGAERTAAYWQARRSADNLVYELLDVGTRLRGVVGDELIRPG